MGGGHGLVGLPGAPVQGLDPQHPVLLVIAGKGHQLALPHRIEEDGPALQTCGQDLLMTDRWANSWTNRCANRCTNRYINSCISYLTGVFTGVLKGVFTQVHLQV